MLHNMKLRNKPFNSIKNGLKTIEMRLYDEKRKLINVGDNILFTNIETSDALQVQVINIKAYHNFNELYKNYDKISLGYGDSEIYDPNDMDIYYTKEEQDKYGVVAIEIKLV